MCMILTMYIDHLGKKKKQNIFSICFLCPAEKRKTDLTYVALSQSVYSAFILFDSASSVHKLSNFITDGDKLQTFTISICIRVLS